MELRDWLACVWKVSADWRRRVRGRPVIGGWIFLSLSHLSSVIWLRLAIEEAEDLLANLYVGLLGVGVGVGVVGVRGGGHAEGSLLLLELPQAGFVLLDLLA